MKSKADNFSWWDVPKSFWYFLEEDKLKFVFFFVVLLVIFFYELVPIYIMGKIVDFFTSYVAGQSLRPFYMYVAFIAVSWIAASLIRLYSKYFINLIGQNARTRART